MVKFDRNISKCHVAGTPGIELTMQAAVASCKPCFLLMIWVKMVSRTIGYIGRKDWQHLSEELPL